MQMMLQTKSKVSNYGLTEKKLFSISNQNPSASVPLRTESEQCGTKLFVYWHSTEESLSPD